MLSYSFTSCFVVFKFRESCTVDMFLGIWIGSWLGAAPGSEQDSEHKLLCLVSALLRASAELARLYPEDRQRCPISLCKWPVLPGLFSESSSYSRERTLKHAVLASRLQCRKLRNKNIPSFNAFHSMLVWSISPRCVFIGSSPTFVYIWLKTPFKVSISCKGYHGKSQYLFV